MTPKISRRRFLHAAAAGGVAWVALGGALGCDPPATHIKATAASAPLGQTSSYRSRPDLHPPAIEVTTLEPGTAPGYVFVASKNGPDEDGPGQDGCMILDNDGQPVWLNLLRNEYFDVMNFKVQEYKGETVLTWWVGHHTGYGQGDYVIADHHYREITRVRAGNGYEGDHHEFLITPENTALITIYGRETMDLTSVGGPAEGTILDGIVQEIDIESGEVLFEWHSLDHIELSTPPAKPYDHLHMNSIDVYDKDHILISARAKSTLYKIDRNTGEVVWRLGGTESDFEMGPGSAPSLQHDARTHPGGNLTIFDNGNMSEVEQSRGIVVSVDEETMKAELVREYTHPDKPRSATQGNVQVLPNGNVFIGWGSEPLVSEFSNGGDLLFSASFPSESETYRAFRFPWKGWPDYAPAIAAEKGPKNEVNIYASWNGATQVNTWEIMAGSKPRELESVGTAPKKGFETVITMKTEETYVGLRARDAAGKVLGSTEVIKPE